MSVCGHDPMCPGFGPEHDDAMGILEEEVKEKVPFMEKIKLPLTGEMSHAKLRRLQRGSRNGGNIRSIAKRNQVLRGKAGKK